MKRRNPRFGCRKIAEQIAHTFGIEIDKDMVRRILAKHYRSQMEMACRGSPLSVMPKTAFGVSISFAVKSIVLQSYSVMVIIDVFSRRLIGFGVERGDIDGVAVCRMFNRANYPDILEKI